MMQVALHANTSSGNLLSFGSRQLQQPGFAYKGLKNKH